MKWSVELKFGSYAKALALSFFPNTYIFWLFFALCLTIALSSDGSNVTLASIVWPTLAYFALMVIVGVVFGAWLQLRRIKKLSGGLQQKYKLDAKTLTVQVGQDMITIPRDSLSVKYCKPNLIIFRRKGARLGKCVLLFDNDADYNRVKKELGIVA